jgi:hypothetical protein
MSERGATVPSEMVAVAWAAIGLLAATLVSTLLYLGSKVDALDAHLTSRIDALDGRLSSRIDSLAARMDAHLERHAG